MEASSLVKLNVGGVIYTTTASTLNKHEGFLQTLVSGAIGTIKDETGAIFIDRNGELFHYVLEFLRSSHLWIEPTDPRWNAFVVEAGFYQIKELLEGAIARKKERIVSIKETPKQESDVTILNVRGNKFIMRTSLLLSIHRNDYYKSYMAGGYFGRLSEYLRDGRKENDILLDHKGRIYVDRNPSMFGAMLSIVCSETPIIPIGDDAKERFKKESEYYFGRGIEFVYHCESTPHTSQQTIMNTC